MHTSRTSTTTAPFLVALIVCADVGLCGRSARCMSKVVGNGSKTFLRIYVRAMNKIGIVEHFHRRAATTEKVSRRCSKFKICMI
jgi:hypothetical protein